MMDFIRIDETKCRLCGACVKDCVRAVLQRKGGRVEQMGNACLFCGHCVAVCPFGAVSFAEGTEECLCSGEPAAELPGSDGLLAAVRARRSVRQYQKKPVERDLIDKVLEAGRFAPSGCNRQPLSYVVLQDELEPIRLLAMDVLKRLAEEVPQNSLIATEQQRLKFRNMCRIYKETGRDMLFFNAPAVIAIVADYELLGRPQLDAGIAAGYMDLVAQGLGLGCCYIGFFVTASEAASDLSEKLGLQGMERIVACMAIGYPDVKYYRTVGRRMPKIKMR